MLPPISPKRFISTPMTLPSAWRIEFQSDDSNSLRGLAAPLQAAWARHADAFYDHLLAFDETRSLLSDPAVMSRLRDSHGRYFHRLYADQASHDYVQNRLNVGLVHQRIGLEPKWYIGAYRKYLASLLPTLLDECRQRDLPADRMIDALFKIVTFDICLAMDSYIDAEKQAQAQAEARSRLRERAMDSSTNGIFIVDIQQPDYPIIYANAAFRKLTGLQHDAAGSQSCLCKRHWESGCMRRVRESVAAHAEGYTIISFPLTQGARRWVELFVSPVKDAANQSTHYIGILHDITARKQAESQLLHQATHDSLTGLANRYQLHQQLTKITEREPSRPLATLFLDLDRFKLINDSLGHDIGDALLCQAAKRLKRCLRGNDTIARFGGDEFVILLDDIRGVEDAQTVAAKILDAFSAPFMIEKHRLFVSTSIGIGLYPEHGGDSQTLLKHADTAMYQAKQAGRNRVAVFSEALGKHASSQLSIENELRQALDLEQLCLYYQPIVDTQDGTIVGAEALLRWQHPQVGLIAPDAFIPQAEESGLILPIGEWVIDRAIAQAAAWQRLGLMLPVSINLSVKECDPSRTAPLIRNALERHQLAPALLQIEITETVMMEQVESVLPMLGSLRALGVRLAMDDFGTGYSSLRYLRDLPLDTLKIDKSFITRITDEPADQAIVSSVISLADKLDIDVIIEGVEQADQVAWLAAAGCHTVQGYYYARPMPAAALESMAQHPK
jgi:diguanylate cyclase (GGDEF)-like protein/PAS domain S-box-containing protein